MKIVHAICLTLSLNLSSLAFAEEFHWKFQTGEQWTIEAEQLTEMQWNSDDSETLSLKQTLVWKTKVEQVSPEGIAALSQELTQAKLTIRSKRGEQSFDSAAPSSDSSSSPYWESTRAQLGKQFRIHVRSTGEAVELHGGSDSKIPAVAAAASYNAMSTPTKALSATSGLGIQFPGDHVQIGEPWTTRSKIGLEGNELLVDTTYQYVGAENLDDKSLDKFKSSTGVRFARPTSETKITKQDSEGTVWFDRQSGKVARLECAQELMISDKDNPNQRLLQSIELKIIPSPTR